MMQSEEAIGELLVKENYLTEDDLTHAQAKATKEKRSVLAILQEDGLISRDLIENALAESYGVPYEPINQRPDPALFEKFPEDLAREFQVLPIGEQDGVVHCTTADPSRLDLLPKLHSIFPMKEIELSYTPWDAMEALLATYRKPLETRFRKILEEHRTVAPEIIDEIFDDALLLRASDIHFEPQEQVVVVRFRIDGVMHEAGRIPKEFYEGIVNRIKIASNMRIDEHFAAQDGAIRWRRKAKAMDVRVSIIPIIDGEKIVMRLLSEYVRSLTLHDLGFSQRDQDILEQCAKLPFGMILTTGPTGSGKSTTLYGLLKMRNTPEVNISTIEDPVEYKITGINHIQVNPGSGLTFAKGLRAIVRQDPDIVLVGEIRDAETAEISVNAALTGHLLFSTLHANDAATAIPRLLEMEIEPFLLASTLELIIAQRLMRRICRHCCVSHTVQGAEVPFLFPGADRYFPTEGSVHLYEGKGCALCSGTGFKGRIGIYELLRVSERIEEHIIQRSSTTEINAMARSEGMRSLFEDGLEKVKAGLSTIGELLRVAAPPLSP